MEEGIISTPVVTIVPARMASRRLPGKPLRPLGDATVLEQALRRLRTAHYGANIIVTTSEEEIDRPIRLLCLEQGVPCLSGNPNEVLLHTAQLASEIGARVAVFCPINRPMIEPSLFDDVVRFALESKLDYVTMASLPSGSNAEVLSLSLLQHLAKTPEELDKETNSDIFSALCQSAELPAPLHLARPDVHLKLDTERDYYLLSLLYLNVKPKANGLLAMEDAIAYLDAHPELQWHGELEWAAIQVA